MAYIINSVDIPKTFTEWTDWFSRQSAITRSKGSKKFGRNDEISTLGNEFVYEFYGHRIARYTPEYTRLYTCGHASSTSTVIRLNDLTYASIYRFGSRNPLHTKLRINGLPFFEGIRVMPDGSVHPEDVRQDVVTSKRHEVVKAYTRLFRQIKDSLRTRWEIGEFDEVYALDYLPPYDYMALERVVALFAEGKSFIHHEWVLPLLAIHQVGSFDEVINAVRERFRNEYLRNNNGFYDEEIKNAA